MNGEEILHFIAIVPNETDFEKENFTDVRSPNPEDMAQFIVKELSKSNQITIISFGPQTITSHSYLVGQVSVLDSLLHSFIDAKIEVKVFLQNSSKRRPSSSSSYYSIKNGNQIDILAKKIQDFSKADFIKVYLNIQKYTIILLSLPSFIPFNSSMSMKYVVNGWNVLMQPASYVNTRAFALLHFDPNLPMESAVLKFLPNEPRKIEFSEEDSVELTDSIEIQNGDRDEYEEDYEDENQLLSSSDSENLEPDNYNNNNYNNSNNLISGGSKSQNDNLLSTSTKDKRSVASSRRSRSSKIQNQPSAASQSSKRNSQIQNGDESVFSEYSRTNQNKDRNVEDYEEELNEQNKSETKKGKKSRQKKILRKKKAKQTINVQELLDTDSRNNKNGESESSVPSESRIRDFYEEEESLNSIEVQIHQFVSNLQLNVPVLTDTSVFSTLFQQLFYERWKSGILNRIRTDLASLQSQLKERSTDEIAGLRQLISSRDMTMFINIEEKRMRFLEAQTVESIQKVMEMRLQFFSEIPQKSLLKNLQILSGDNVTLNKQLREKRAETRQQIIDLRLLQFSRIQKMQDYHKKVEELELAASGQARYEKALAELNRINQEKKKLEADREALLSQREKVMNMLKSKKLKISNNTKKK